MWSCAQPPFVADVAAGYVALCSQSNDTWCKYFQELLLHLPAPFHQLHWIPLMCCIMKCSNERATALIRNKYKYTVTLHVASWWSRLSLIRLRTWVWYLHSMTSTFSSTLRFRLFSTPLASLAAVEPAVTLAQSSDLKPIRPPPRGAPAIYSFQQMHKLYLFIRVCPQQQRQMCHCARITSLNAHLTRIVRSTMHDIESWHFMPVSCQTHHKEVVEVERSYSSCRKSRNQRKLLLWRCELLFTADSDDTWVILVV